MKVVLLNGPPRCGKDTAAEMLLRSLPRAAHLKFADPLRNAVPAMFGLSRSTWLDLYLTDKKEKPTPLLQDHSPRSAMIWLSEQVMKPWYGKNIFGHLAVNQLREMVEDVVISDCGFTHELEPMRDYLGANSMLIVRLHRTGRSFDGDSRGFVDMPGVHSLDIHNDGTLSDLEAQLVNNITPWLTTGEHP